MALPGRKDEAWRWAELAQARAHLGAAAPANDALPDTGALWLDIESDRRLFIGGQPIGHAGHLPAPDAGFPAHPLADMAATHATAGTVLDVPANHDGGTVQLLHLGTSGMAHGITRVKLGANARLTIVETLADGGADHWLNLRFDASLGEGAELVRVVRIATGHGLASERAAIRLGRAARFSGLSVVLAGGDARTETLVQHDGDGAHAQVNGVLLGDNRAHLDAMTTLEHRVPGATSGQVWRLVGAGRARVSVAGGVKVARNAQKTDASQSLKALVLNRTAAANLKPELEIFADDVQCAHGCTVGELDKAALFYLQSRGIALPEAEALLTRAFVADALGGLPEGPLAQALDRETHAWLEARL